MARRSNGEGSFYRRPDGRWQGRISYLNETTGKRERVAVYGKTKNEARDKLKAARDRLDAGKPPKDASVTVAEWMAHWRSTSLEASDRKPTTKELYAGLSVKHLEAGALGAVTLKRLRATHVEALVVELRERGLSESSVTSIYTVFRGALDVAVRDGHLARNPAALVRRPKVTVKEAVFLSTSDVVKLLKAAEGSRYVLALRLIATTGLRAGEAAGLRWADVDLDAGSLRVRTTASRLKGGIELTEPKTDKSKRTVPLPTSIVVALRKHRTEQLKARLAAGDQWRENGLVFPTEFGTPLDPRNLRRVVAVAAANAGLSSDVGVHTLRHSAAVAWLEAGVHVRGVADLLGHSSIAITADIYGHTSAHIAKGAVEGLSDALG